ncbi:MAG TPA: hypothetical protein VFY06_11935 [Verrucomicrobiae bacterium]|nr:hypothetical protein [Verrucomicrobiae bacterium]
MEGAIYECSWKKSGRIFSLWVLSRPEVCVEAKDFENGYDDLADEICGAFGDGEAILEFEPAPPVARTSKRYICPDIVLLGYYRSADGPWGRAGVFSKGYCPHCAMGMGERTDLPAIIEKAEPHDVLGLRTGNYGTTLRLFSADFLKLLTKQECASLSLLETDNRSNVRKTFYELRGKPQAGYVSFRGAKYNKLSCWHCPYCGYRNLHPKHPLLGFDVSRFIATADLPNPPRSCFIIGEGVNLDLVMTRERWMQIRGKPGTKGVDPIKIGIIPDSELVRNPKLKDVGDLRQS